MKLSKNKILITGGASGIGLGLAERFVQEGSTVIVCGRRADALKEAAARVPSVITKVSDLSTDSGREALLQWVKKEHPDVNVLVNNAGMQNWMDISAPDFYTRAKDEIAINVEAPVHLTALFLGLKHLDTILNVTSGLAFIQLTKVPVYCATKAFLHSFTVSLRAQLKSRSIEVIEVIPPALNTDLGGKGIHDHAPPVSEFIESIFAQLKQGKTELTFGFTETISKAGKEILEPIFAKMNASV